MTHPADHAPAVLARLRRATPALGGAGRPLGHGRRGRRNGRQTRQRCQLSSESAARCRKAASNHEVRARGEKREALETGWRDIPNPFSAAKSLCRVALRGSRTSSPLENAFRRLPPNLRPLERMPQFAFFNQDECAIKRDDKWQVSLKTGENCRLERPGSSAALARRLSLKSARINAERPSVPGRPDGRCAPMTFRNLVYAAARCS